MNMDFVSFDQFSDMAEELIRLIPDKFKKGLSGIYISPEEVRDDDIPGVYVLGHYTHGSYYEPSIDIYYGSFRKVFNGFSSFQLQNELWETITHEIRHHWQKKNWIGHPPSLSRKALKKQLLILRIS